MDNNLATTEQQLSKLFIENNYSEVYRLAQEALCAYPDCASFIVFRDLALTQRVGDGFSNKSLDQSRICKTLTDILKSECNLHEMSIIFDTLYLLLKQEYNLTFYPKELIALLKQNANVPSIARLYKFFKKQRYKQDSEAYSVVGKEKKRVRTERILKCTVIGFLGIIICVVIILLNIH